MNHSATGSKVSRSRRSVFAAIGIGAAAFLAAPAAAREKTPSPTIEEKANIQTIDSFIAAWNAKDATKVMSFFAEDARFTVGPIGKTPEFRKPDFARLIQSASRLRMTITPGTTWARGPVVAHEHVDDIVLPQRKIAGRYLTIFTLRNGKIVDFIEFAY